MRGRLPTSAGAHSNPAADLGLGRQGVGIEPEVGMRFRALGSYRSAFRNEANGAVPADGTRCWYCLEAKATGSSSRGSGSSHAPTSCLCRGSGTVALPWVIAASTSPTSLETPTFVRRQARSAVSGSACGMLESSTGPRSGRVQSEEDLPYRLAARLVGAHDVEAALD